MTKRHSNTPTNSTHLNTHFFTQLRKPYKTKRIVVCAAPYRSEEIEQLREELTGIKTRQNAQPKPATLGDIEAVSLACHHGDRRHSLINIHVSKVVAHVTLNS